MAVGKACHNCRRRRLRCDRSIPECNKCLVTGQQCLGYGQLFRWRTPLAPQHPTASARKNSTTSTCQKVAIRCNGFCSLTTPGRRCEGHACPKSRSLPHLRIAQTLVDPLFQDLDDSCRRYMKYFTERFCPDLVVHDDGNHMSNPFRQLVAMSGIHVSLRHIITATSAMHYRMATRHGSIPGQDAVSASALVDALRARQLAIHSLREILDRQKLSGNDESCFGRGEKDALFATMVFFINFTLLDSEQSEWRAHMEAAGNFIVNQTSNATREKQEFQQLAPANWLPISEDNQKFDTSSTMIIDDPLKDGHSSFDASSLSCHDHQLSARDYIASDFVSYYIWTCALESLVSGASSKSTGRRSIATSLQIEPATALPLLLRTEHNTYHSCPAYLFYNILRVSHIARSMALNRGDARSTTAQLEQVASILHEAQYFDIDGWAARVCAINAATTPAMRGKDLPLEIERRRHMAATYRATTCLFILLAIPGIQEFVVSSYTSQEAQSKPPNSLPTTTDLASTILSQLSHIPPSSPLFKYTTWPVFMAGVETRQPRQRAWAMERLQAMWELCPWGMLQSAMSTLGDIWGLRDSAAARAMKGIETLMMKSEEEHQGALVDKASVQKYEGQIIDIKKDDDVDDDEDDDEDDDDGAKWMARLRDLDLKIDYLII